MYPVFYIVVESMSTVVSLDSIRAEPLTRPETLGQLCIFSVSQFTHL